MFVSLFDTRIADNNLGNAIIMDAVCHIADELFPQAFLLHHSCLDPIGKTSQGYIAQSEYTFFGGTNMLSSHMQEYNQWEIESSRHIVQNVILCGVGWWQYQGDVDSHTQGLLRDVLHPYIYHAVRDGYTESKLRSIGFQNVLNTACPTMWELTAERCAKIPTGRAESVVVTLTNYNTQPKADVAFLNLMKKMYKRIYLWVQGPEDAAYAKSLCPDIDILAPRLSALDEKLTSDEDIEYVGTRLHAGVRALQHGRRSVILRIDNRASEISRDTGLFTVARDDMAELQKSLEAKRITSLRLPWKAIESWKKQFIA